MKETFVNEKQAISAAEKLCKLLGPDWKPCVWHNGVWCYEAVYKSVVHVHPHVKGTFFCLIGECGMSAMLAPEGVPHLTDPAEVVRLTVEGYKKKWLAFRREQEAFVRSGEECLPKAETKEERRLDNIRRQARDLYGCDDIRFDEGDIAVSESDEGAFVAAWVWVGKE